MKFLYKNFLENKNTYRWNKTFWKNEIQTLCIKNDIDFKNFETYVTDKYTNGKLFYDGNPIYSAKIMNKNKAFRIIQENPLEFENYFTSFINESNDLISCNELVIVLTLTHENKKKAFEEILNWIK